MSSLVSGIKRGLTGEGQEQQGQQQQQQGQQGSSISTGTQPNVESLSQMLFGTTIREDKVSGKKVSIVGTGQVGSAIAYTLMCQDITHEIALYDIDEERLNGELLDLKQCLPFLCNIKVYGDTDLKTTENSAVVIITAGERQEPGENPQDLLDRNKKVFKDIVPNLVKYSPDAIFLVVTNPSDSLAYYTWKLSGLPENRVIGFGTSLDSCRFRYFIGESLGISPHSVNAWVLGEDGPKAVPIWSGVNAGGCNFHCMCPKIGTNEDKSNMKQVFQQVLESADKITGLKGYTNWAAGLSVAKVCKAILKNEKSIFALSTSTKNWNQTEKCNLPNDIFMSLPCVIGEKGVIAVMNQSFSDDECNRIKESGQKLSELQKKLNA